MKKINKKMIAIVGIVSFALGFTVNLSAFAASVVTPVNLGSANNYAVLAKTGISTTGATKVTGNIGVSPIAATAITGFALTLPVGGAFSTSALVTGNVYAPGYANPTPTNLTMAVSDMQTAYTDAQGRTNPTVTELGAGNIGGKTLAPGLYKWGTGVTIPADVTLSGNANDVWIFQIAQNLNVSSGVKIILAGGAKENNVFWAVAGQTTIGTTAVISGNILDKTAIVLKTGARLNGRALAQTAVTLDANTVTMPTSEPVVMPTIPAVPATHAAALLVVCTQEVKQCSDGSYVGRIPPNCEFKKCPDVVVSTTTKTLPTASNFGQQVKAIAVNLGQGSKDNNVKTLQDFLISQDKGPAAKVLAKVGSTGNFGTLTKAALAEFQVKVGIKPASGNFGSITRAYLIANYK